MTVAYFHCLYSLQWSWTPSTKRKLPFDRLFFLSSTFSNPFHFAPRQGSVFEELFEESFETREGREECEVFTFFLPFLRFAHSLSFFLSFEFSRG